MKYKYEVGEYYQTTRGAILKLIEIEPETLLFKTVFGKNKFLRREDGLIPLYNPTSHKLKKLDNKNILEALYGN